MNWILPRTSPRPMLISGVCFFTVILIVLQLCSSLTVPRAGDAHDLPGAAPAAATQLSAAEWGQIAPLMREAEYQATPRARADGRVAFWAPNQANDLSLSFGPDGLEVTPWQGDKPWSFSLRAAAYGPAGSPTTLSGTPVLSANRQRVDYRWAGLSEWYTNSTAGLKHNITLEQPIAANHLQVDLALGGSLHPQVRPGGQAVTFVDGSGATVLDLGALYVYDATGQTLAARFGAPITIGLVTTLPILVEAAGAAFPITIDPLLTSPRPKVTASDPEAGALFGQQVAIDGEVLTVGAPSKNERGQNSGAVYVFTRNQGGADRWGQVKKLVPADGGADDGFGRAVALDGNTLVVGAPLANVRTTDDGAVYVFERHSGGPENWGQQQKLEIAANVRGNNFGASIAIHTDTIAVGAPLDDIKAPDGGAVYTFVKRRVSGAGVRWELEERILPGEALRSGAGFGRAVALDGHTLVVGAPGQGAFPNVTGAAYVFQHHRDTLGGWAEARKLVGTDSRTSDNVGTAVAIAGDTIVVGAPQHDVGAAANQGAAYLFSRNQGGADRWDQTTKLMDSGGAANDLFGVAVAADGATAVIGAPFDDDETRGLSDSGSLTIVVNGRFFAKLTGADAASGDSFGGAVAIDGDLIAAGARRHDSGAADAGAIYLFTLASEAWGEVRRHDGSLSCCIGQNIALDGDTLVAAEKNGGEGLIIIFRRNSQAPDTWGEIKRFAIPAEPTGTRVPLTLSGDVLAVLGDDAVYIFERNRGGKDAWNQQRRKGIGDSQGAYLALDGDTLIVGEPAADDRRGAIHVFERHKDGRNQWGGTQLLLLADVPPSPSPAIGFGGFVAIDGNLLAAMSFSLPRLPSGEPGPTAVYIFEREGGEQPWRFVGQPRPAQPIPGFATRVDVAGDTIAISTRPAFDSTRTYLPNAVSLFRRNQGGANAWGEIKRLPVPPEAVGFGAGLALDGDTVAVGAPQTDLGNRPGGAVYLFERNIGGAEGWGQLTTLHGSFSSPADDLGMEVALDGNTLAAGAGGAVYAYRNGVRNPTGLGLHTEANSLQPGQPVTLKATISGAAGGAEDGAALALSVPQGEIAFFLNGEPAGTAQLDAQGQASLTLTGLPLGVHELTARFAGNDRWTACESPPLTLFVGVEPSVPVPDTLTIFLPLLQR